MMFRSALICLAASMATLSQAQDTPCPSATTSLTVEDYTADLVPAATTACGGDINMDCTIDFSTFDSYQAFQSGCNATFSFETVDLTCDDRRRVTVSNVPFCHDQTVCNDEAFATFRENIAFADIQTALTKAGVGSEATGFCYPIDVACDGHTQMSQQDYADVLVPAAEANCTGNNMNLNCNIDFSNFATSDTYIDFEATCAGSTGAKLINETVVMNCGGRVVTTTDIPLCQKGPCDTDSFKEYSRGFVVSAIGTTLDIAGVLGCSEKDVEVETSASAASLTMMIPTFVILGGYIFL